VVAATVIVTRVLGGIVSRVLSYRNYKKLRKDIFSDPNATDFKKLAKAITVRSGCFVEEVLDSLEDINACFADEDFTASFGGKDIPFNSHGEAPLRVVVNYSLFLFEFYKFINRLSSSHQLFLLFS